MDYFHVALLDGLYVGTWLADDAAAAIQLAARQDDRPADVLMAEPATTPTGWAVERLSTQRLCGHRHRTIQAAQACALQAWGDAPPDQANMDLVQFLDGLDASGALAPYKECRREPSTVGHFGRRDNVPGIQPEDKTPGRPWWGDVLADWDPERVEVRKGWYLIAGWRDMSDTPRSVHEHFGEAAAAWKRWVAEGDAVRIVGPFDIRANAEVAHLRCERCLGPTDRGSLRCARHKGAR